MEKSTFQISFVLHLDEAVHILYKPLPLYELPPYTTATLQSFNTQMALIFKAAYV